MDEGYGFVSGVKAERHPKASTELGELLDTALTAFEVRDQLLADSEPSRHLSLGFSAGSSGSLQNSLDLFFHGL